MSNFRFRLFAIAAVVMTMTTALSIPSIAGADAASVVPGITITKTNDGTATFDPTDDPGSDSSATNGIVRTNDTVTFSINYSFSDPLAAAPTPYSNFRFQLAELPLGFVYAQLPPVCPTSGVTHCPARHELRPDRHRDDVRHPEHRHRHRTGSRGFVGRA